MRTTLARLASGGELHQVVKDLFYPTACMAEAGGAGARCGGSARMARSRPAAFRDATGLGRKRAIQLLEYFDHIGLLRRVGDVHRLRSDSVVFQGERHEPRP